MSELENSLAKFESHSSCICESYVLQKPQVSYYSSNTKKYNQVLMPTVFKHLSQILLNLALVSRTLFLRSANIAFQPTKISNHLAVLLFISCGSLGCTSVILLMEENGSKGEHMCLCQDTNPSTYIFYQRLKPALFKSCRCQPSIDLLQDEIVVPRC